jgi:hypothetical protein
MKVSFVRMAQKGPQFIERFLRGQPVLPGVFGDAESLPFINTPRQQNT